MKKLAIFLILAAAALVVVVIVNTNQPIPAAVQDPQVRAQLEQEQERAVGGAIILRREMRDPHSFTLESADVKASGAVCYKYRAQNGLGGMNLEFAVLSPGAQDLNRNASAWTRECAHKVGHDQTFAVRARMGER